MALKSTVLCSCVESYISVYTYMYNVHSRKKTVYGIQWNFVLDELDVFRNCSLFWLFPYLYRLEINYSNGRYFKV